MKKYIIGILMLGVLLFAYFAGSVPDKHSGEVSMEKAYDYLCGLKTK